MARISRRNVFHAAGASLLAAALTLPTGTTIAAAGPQSRPGDDAGVPAPATEPPPSNDSTELEAPPDSPPDSEPPSEPDGPTEPTTSTPSTSIGPDTTQPTDPGDTEGRTPDPPPEQTVEIDEATTTLNEQKERVPEELTPTVEALIALVGRADDPKTLAQDRQGVIESAEHLSTALTAISDPSTSPELRKELTAIVKQVTSTLEVVSAPQVPPEERSMLILVAKRTTSTLHTICDPKTPPAVRDPMIATLKDTNHVAESSQDQPETLRDVSASGDIGQDRRTPPKEREELAHITQQVSALLRKISDTGASQEERSAAGKELDEKTSRMKDEQEEAASAQDRPKESLGRAAAFCTSAIFEATRESALMEGLRKLVPAQWEKEGVKDFWKAEEKSNDMLDVLAQLRSNEHTHGPFEVVPLITALAELVPHDRLFGTLGGSALYCEQTAKYLEEEAGVTVGTWLTKTGE